MDESAPVEPLKPREKQLAAGWIRFMSPQPATISVRAATSLLRHVAGECGAWMVVLVVALALLAPILAFAVAGGWALYTYVHALVALWQHVKAYQLSNLTPLLDSLSLAARVALASAGYFALLSALIVLMSGLLGRRWRRLFLFPGITFTLPSALTFFFGLRLSLDALAKPLHISLLAQTALLAYLLLDVMLLAAALADVSPRKRRTRRTRSARWMSTERQRMPSAPLAPIHFGPSGPPTPLTAAQADVAAALAAVSEAPAANAELEAAAMDAALPDACAMGGPDAGATCPAPPPLVTALADEHESAEADADAEVATVPTVLPLAPVG